MNWCRSNTSWHRRQWEHLGDEEAEAGGRGGQSYASPLNRWQRHWRQGRQAPRQHPPLYQQRLRRLPEEGIIAGVCAGVAEHLQVSPKLVRALCVLGAFACGFFPLVILYGVLYMVLPRGPLGSELGRAAEDGWQPAASSAWERRTLQTDLKAMEQRTSRLESYLISSEYEWERKYRGL